MQCASSRLSELSDYLHCPNLIFLTTQSVHSFLCTCTRKSFVFSCPLLRCTLSIFKPCLTSWTNLPRLSARHESRLCDRALSQLGHPTVSRIAILFWTWGSDPSLVPYSSPPFRILPSIQPSRSRRSPCPRHSETQPCRAFPPSSTHSRPQRPDRRPLPS